MSETNNILPPPRTQFINGSGVPLAGGMVYTYDATGVTPKATYQNAGNTTLNTNPIVLDSIGSATIWGQGSYVLLVEDSLGNVLYEYSTQDPAGSLGVSTAMLPVLQAQTTSAALALLGGQPLTAALPYGIPFPYAGPTAPTGWAFCYGQAVGRVANPNLFAAIGTTWGAGDGATTFNLPDLRGYVIAGADAMGGIAAGRLGNTAFGFCNPTTGVQQPATLAATGGTQLLAAHNHSIVDPGHNHALNYDKSNGGVLGLGNSGNYAPNSARTYDLITLLGVATATTGVTVASAGGGLSGNVQPTVVMNYIMALA